jgi:hypothetical protein
VIRLSEFDTVLNQVLALTEATTTECALLPPESVERYRCEGKLVALHQVIEFLFGNRQARIRSEGLARSGIRLLDIRRDD